MMPPGASLMTLEGRSKLWHHTYDCRDDRNMFIVEATELSVYLKKHNCSFDIKNCDCNHIL